MHYRKMKKLLSLILVVGLVFTSGMFTFADDNDEPDLSGDLNSEDFTEPETEPLFSPTAANLTLTADNGYIEIKHVRVLYGGAVQARYRNADSWDVSKYTVYRGDDPVYGTNGENAASYYTTSRIASMTDPRIFTMVLTIPLGLFDSLITDDVPGDNPFDPGNIVWKYKGATLTHKTKANEMTHTSMAVDTIGSPEVQIVGSDIVLTQEIKFNSFNSSTGAASGNTPHSPYASMSHLRTNIGLVGDWNLAAYYGSEELDSIMIRQSENDAFQTYNELDAFVRDYIATYGPDGGDTYGPYGRYLRFESLGNSLEGRDMWAAVISDSKASVDYYLNTTKPLLNDDPAALQAAIKAGEAGSHKGVLYVSTIHGDEQTGPAVAVSIIDRLLKRPTLRFTKRDEANTIRAFPTTIQNVGNGFRSVDPANPGVPIETELNVDEFLDNFILVFVLHGSPDGLYHSYWGSSYNLDLNRDASYFSQLETRAMARGFNKWDPIYMLELHGYYGNYIIDGVTPPYEPNYEMDIIDRYMTPICDSMGMAIIGNSPHIRYTHPTRDVVQGWDCGSTIYTPALAQLYGSLGSTVEFPNSTQDSVDAGVQGLFGLFEFCTAEKDGLLDNKAEFKRRGVENLDLKETVDKYHITVHELIEEVRAELDAFWESRGSRERVPESVIIGRPRKSDGAGGELPFFPEYHIIPVDPSVQMSPGNAYEAMSVLTELGGVKLEKTTVPVVFDGVTYPAGTYIVNMHQAARAFANVMLYDGYDASIYEYVYDSGVINYPAMRGFDRVSVYEKNVFAGKTTPVGLTYPAAAVAGEGYYTIIRNDSDDAIRLVNRLLKAGKEVRMVIGPVQNASLGDFVAAGSDALAAAVAAPNTLFGDKQLNVTLFGYGNAWPKNAKQVVKPNIGYGAEMGNYNSRSDELIVEYVLDLLEFEDAGKLNITTSNRETSRATNVKPGANVYLLSNSIPDGALLNEIRTNKIPVVFAGSCKTNTPVAGPGANMLIENSNDWIRTVDLPSGTELLVKAKYSPSSLILSNLKTQKTVYLMNTATGFALNSESPTRYISSLPDFTKPIIEISDEDNLLIAGKISPMGSADSILKGKAVAASGIYNDIPFTVMTNNVFGKAGCQLYYRIIGTALFAYASGITDIWPTVYADPEKVETGVMELKVALDVRAVDTIGDIAGITVTGKKYKVSNSPSEPAFDPADPAWKDIPANNQVAIFNTGSGNGTYYLHWYVENSSGVTNQGTFGPYVKMPLSATPSAYVTKLNGNQNDLTISVLENFGNGAKNVITVTLKINNNAAGTYKVGDYKVYVDTKGNTQIREIYIVK